MDAKGRTVTRVGGENTQPGHQIHRPVGCQEEHANYRSDDIQSPGQQADSGDQGRDDQSDTRITVWSRPAPEPRGDDAIEGQRLERSRRSQDTGQSRG